MLMADWTVHGIAARKGCSAFSWKPCTDVESKSSIKDVGLTPDPPFPGSTAQFTIDATADVEIAAGTLDISVAYHGFPIYSESKDLCDKTECPVKKGPVKVALEEPFPIITPPGPYTVRITAKGKGNDAPQLFCLDVDFNVVPHGSATQQNIRPESS
ncbi:g10836 [Coccomyxa elongata]